MANAENLVRWNAGEACALPYRVCRQPPCYAKIDIFAESPMQKLLLTGVGCPSLPAAAAAAAAAEAVVT